jgi:zinc resistance-associated protein
MEVQMNKRSKKIFVITVVAVFGIATLAFAGWSRGYGHMMGYGGMGPGWNHMGGYGYDQRGYYGNLSQEEVAKLDQQRAEFFKETENIRQQLYEKELALRSELAKENPDTSKASSLQNEISKLQSDLDQKRLDYEIQARKIAPDYNRGFGGYGPMMGYGPRGGEYCMW